MTRTASSGSRRARRTWTLALAAAAIVAAGGFALVGPAGAQPNEQDDGTDTPSVVQPAQQQGPAARIQLPSIQPVAQSQDG